LRQGLWLIQRWKAFEFLQALSGGVAVARTGFTQ
jgi:hypothetical protein